MKKEVSALITKCFLQQSPGSSEPLRNSTWPGGPPPPLLLQVLTQEDDLACTLVLLAHRVVRGGGEILQSINLKEPQGGVS